MELVEVAPAARLEVLEVLEVLVALVVGLEALVMPVEPVLVLVEQSVPEQGVEVEQLAPHQVAVVVARLPVGLVMEPL